MYSEQGVRLEPKNTEIYYSYTKWVTDKGKFGEDVSKREDKKLYPHAMKAKEIYLEMTSVYDKKLLLHGHLSSNYIISCGNDFCGRGKYKVTHPTGVIGDPVFDAGAFIFGECCWYGKPLAEPEKAEIIINYLEKSLNIPNKILRQAFYITTVMCYEGDIARIKFAENVMNKGK
jgi:streptomycin 6-kinase